MTRRIGLLAATMFATATLGSGAQAAKPIAKSCGPNDHYTIGMSQANFKEPYRAAMNADLENMVKKIPQFKIVIADGQANDNTQVSQVENFLTQQVDLLLISAFEAAPLTTRRQPCDGGGNSGDRDGPQNRRRQLYQLRDGR